MSDYNGARSRATLDAALAYARGGLRVHPLVAGTKRPMLDAWQHRATTDRAIIKDGWRRYPDAGIGIATGATSGVVVVDVDEGRGGYDALAQLEREHGELPATWRVLTAHGGLHLYLAHPGGTAGNRVDAWPGIDVRGDGGYVVAPPTVLDDGGRYAFEIGYGPDELPLAATPTWLTTALAERDNAVRAGRSPDAWATLVRDGVEEGRRNVELTRLVGHWLRHWLPPREVLELARLWNRACRPPLPEDDVRKIVSSICRREARRRVQG